MKHNKKIVILLGPPGSGKGTQGQLLSEKFTLYFLETSKLAEDIFVRGEKEVDGYSVEEQKRLRLDGKLFEPGFAWALIKKSVLNLSSADESILLSGSPRTMYEAEKFIDLVIDLYGKENIYLFALYMDEEISVFRNSHRRICKLMRHSILYNEDTKDLKTCPIDGSELVVRKGLDTPETIRKRLVEYKERTQPIVDYLKSRGIKSFDIDASLTPAQVFNEICKSL